MGRPKKTVTKEADLHVRFDSEERAKLTEKAALAGMSVSAFIRRAALGKRIYSKQKYLVISDAINELARLGRLQKYLAMKNPSNKSEYKALFLQINQQVKHIGELLDKADVTP